MLRRLLAFLVSLSLLPANEMPLQPGHVAVVYNSSLPTSKELAESYAILRGIPLGNLVGLPMPDRQDITRAEYVAHVRNPLRKEFDQRKWWTMGQDRDGVKLPVDATIRCIALMRGVPLRIKRIPIPPAEAEKKIQFNENNEASVDSELTLLGVQRVAIGSAIPNQYFNQNVSFVKSPAKFMILVGRIDAKDDLTCQRMILDAIETEKEGLWGKTYLDFSLKKGAYAVGENWLEAIKTRSLKNGIPIITERTRDTFTTNYPMTEAALYFGWYTFHRNGPFLNPEMKFKRGAIAVHLHSLSAGQLGNPSKNWAAALLDRGATATLGNTWEPYLQLSHNFDIFHQRLIQGYTLVEAAYMAHPALSWQGVVLGDPLYRPYQNFSMPPQDLSNDKDYKAIRLAHLRWTDPAILTQKLRGAAKKLKSGTIQEAIGFALLESKQFRAATELFEEAGKSYKTRADKLRVLLNQAELLRRQEKPKEAINLLRSWRARYADMPEVKAVDGLLSILDPPAPPPAKKK